MMTANLERRWMCGCGSKHEIGERIFKPVGSAKWVCAACANQPAAKAVVLSDLAVSPATPAGAEFLASIAPREPRVQRDTGICNRCGYDAAECSCR